MDHPPYPSTTASTNPSMKRHFGEPAGPGGDAAAAPTRLEKKKSLTTKGSIGEGGGMRSVAALQDTVNDLRAELDRLRKNCTCVICQELLFEPYFLQCGHTYCYHCIVQWVKQASNRKSRCCPECRTPLTIQPAPAYPIRNMVDLFVHHAEIHSVPGSGPDLRKQQLEMAEVVKKHLQGPGLFEGMFLKKPTPVGVRDRDDGVLRCPSCAWEVHDGRCENPRCNIRVARPDFSDEDSDEELEFHEDMDAIRQHWIESEFDTNADLTAEEDDADSSDGHPTWGDFGINSPEDFGLPSTEGSTEGLDDDDDDDDDGPVTNRSRGGRYALNTSDDDSDGTEGSMRDFIEHDTPDRSTRRTSRPRSSSPWDLSSSSPPAQPVQQTRRPNARRVIIDDDDDDDPSSTSEASSMPARSSRRAQFDLSSDYDEDEEESALLRTGYQSLNHQTASENEDDVVYSSRRRRRFPGPIREEDETEYETMNESDTDGDIRMVDAPSRPTNSRSNSVRIHPQPIDLDSADDSDLPVIRRRRPARQGAPSSSSSSAAGRNTYFSSHARGSNSRGNGNRPLSALVDPNIASLFQSHGQRLAEHQLTALGGRRTSVSPSRSVTPVQRDITGGRRQGALSRETTPLPSVPPPPSALSNVQSTESQKPTAVRGSRQSSVASEQTAFSPMQSPDPSPASPPQPQLPRTNTVINLSSALTSPATPAATTTTPLNRPTQAPSSPLAPPNTHGSNATLNARLASLSPRLGNRNPFSVDFMSFNPSPVHRVSSPGVRVRPRTSRTQLRNSSSRSGLRGNSSHQPPILGAGTLMSNNIAGSLSGRVLGRPRQWTPEDVRRLGMQARQNPAAQQQRNAQRTQNEVAVENAVTLSPPPPSRRMIASAAAAAQAARNVQVSQDNATATAGGGQAGNGINGGSSGVLLGNGS